MRKSFALFAIFLSLGFLSGCSDLMYSMNDPWLSNEDDDLLVSNEGLADPDDPPASPVMYRYRARQSSYVHSQQQQAAANSEYGAEVPFGKTRSPNAAVTNSAAIDPAARTTLNSANSQSTNVNASDHL